MFEWEFDVAVTSKDLAKQGILVHHWRWVQVSALDYPTARLIALEMAAIDGAMPTETRLRV